MKLEFDLLSGDADKLIEKLESTINKVDDYEYAVNEKLIKKFKENINDESNSIQSLASSYASEEIPEIYTIINSYQNHNEEIWDDFNKVKLINTTQDATYGEFGTGMIGSNDPHVLNILGWEYDVNEHGEKGWRYKGSNGRLVRTYGLPSLSVYYNSFQKGLIDLEKISKQTFKVVFTYEE